jgi:hypothetical protein
MDALCVAPNVGEHLPERSSRCVHIDRRPSHVRQQRVEDHVVLRIEKQNFALGQGHLTAQGPGELHGSKSAPDDDNSRGGHWQSRLKVFSVILF